MEEIDESNEWLLRRMNENSCENDDNHLVFDGDNLPWEAVGTYVTRSTRINNNGDPLIELIQSG